MASSASTRQVENAPNGFFQRLQIVGAEEAFGADEAAFVHGSHLIHYGHGVRPGARQGDDDRREDFRRIAQRHDDRCTPKLVHSVVRDDDTGALLAGEAPLWPIILVLRFPSPCGIEACP